MCLFTYLFTEACLEHVKYSDGEFVKIVNGLWLLATFCKTFVWDACLGSAYV